ncbi:DUF4350 domain-containing protein [Labrys okinawensis]|uniref:DUF4350 domain-containing protein n=1 Tax=Labrys okinawensis TaxID=346911 RepID=UPI0039BD88C0
MSEQSTFSGPVVAVLIAGATAVFALSMLLMINGSSEDTSYATTTKSISAIGHAGLYELAQRFDIPVERSRINGVVAPGEGGILVMAEPTSSFSSDDIIRLGRESNVLLVLPKRWASADRSRSGWIRSTSPIPESWVAGIVGLVDAKASITRGDPPRAWDRNEIGIDPSFDDGAQLIKSDALTPIVGNAQGMLIGEKLDGDRRTWVLSDPDIIENHGLAKGRNAAFAMALLNAMRDGDSGKVVFDETIHGMVNVVDSPFKKLFQFPYVIVLVLVLSAAGLLIWATTSRFGKPRQAPPAFDFGKGRLIANTASLLDRAGHHAFVMRRYVRATLRDAGRLFHAPRQLDDEQLAAWLDKIGASRGIDTKSADILARTSDSHSTSLLVLFQAARDIHQWKEDISDGTSARS